MMEEVDGVDKGGQGGREAARMTKYQRGMAALLDAGYTLRELWTNDRWTQWKVVALLDPDGHYHGTVGRKTADALAAAGYGIAPAEGKGVAQFRTDLEAAPAWWGMDWARVKKRRRQDDASETHGSTEGSD